MILADEFRDGNVPAGTGNQRLIERAVAHLPPGIARLLVRADSAAYETARHAAVKNGSLVGATYQGKPMCVAPRNALTGND